MSSSSSHTNLFHQRPPGRIPSDSSSGSSSWHSHKHWPADPADMDQPFTTEMRDRQARGKDPYLSEVSDGGGPGQRAGRVGMGGGGGGGGGGVGGGSSIGGMHSIGGMRIGGAGASRQPKEPFQKTERRDWAETVLDNPELLMMYAQSSGDTLPATRLKFKKIMCGLDEDELDDASLPDMSRGGAGGQYQNQQLQRFNTSSSSSAAAHQHGGRGGGGGGGEHRRT